MLLTKKKKVQMLNCQEAFNLWDIVASKYEFLTILHIYENFIHDLDLKKIVGDIIASCEGNIRKFEAKLDGFGISGPDAGIINVRTAINTEVFRDETIAKEIFLRVQGNVELVLRTIRTTTTNDDLRESFIALAKVIIDGLDWIVRYLRVKGWINNAPIYPNTPAGTTEKIDAGEAFHLWDHLTFRYDNVHQTEMFTNMAKDADLKYLLTNGLHNVLLKQAKQLEEECLYFGVPLPKHPPNVVSFPPSFTEVLSDDFIFRSLYKGIIGATLLHASALKQCVTNDRVRKIFKELLLTELEIENKIIVYGKIKGYLNEPPQFNPGK